MARSFRVAVTSIMLVAALARSASAASAASFNKSRLKAAIESLSVVDGKTPGIRPLRTFYWIFYWFKS